MRQLPIDVRKQALDHAKNEFPRECCGLVILKRGKTVYFPCKNISEDNTTFVMDPKDYVAAESSGDIVALVHSHCNAPATPSLADKSSCEASGFPWHIVSLPNEGWDYCEPSGFKAPLIGRPYVYGIHDCYTLICDWYREKHNIVLPEFDRPDGWWDRGENLYLENFGKVGFSRIADDDTIRPGDVIIMQMARKVADHGAVYLGEDIMLHHQTRRLSCREVYGGYWAKHTVAIIRNSSLS